LLLAIDPSMGRARSEHRGEPVDRLEREDQSFYERIESAYRELAAAEPVRIRTIDAAQEPARVLADALEALSDLI
jgi:dTMP kinase